MILVSTVFVINMHMLHTSIMFIWLPVHLLAKINKQYAGFYKCQKLYFSSAVQSFPNYK
jgi:hypothetical protein